MRADLRRRSVLAAAGAAVPLLATGCKGVGGLGTLPQQRPDVAVLRRAISAEQALIARYRAALASWPALKDTLDPVLSQHLAHLTALRSRLVGATATPHPPRSSPAASPTASQAADQAGALAVLAAAEQAAAGTLVSRLTVASPSLAQLLASISASEASHAALLRMQRSAS